MRCTGQAAADAAGERADAIGRERLDAEALEVQLQLADLDGEIYDEDLREAIGAAADELAGEYGRHLRDWAYEEIESRVVI